VVPLVIAPMTVEDIDAAMVIEHQAFKQPWSRHMYMSDLQHNREHPIGSLLYTISCMHCMTVSLAQGGDGLGAMWGKEMAVRYLQDAGFHSVEVHELAHDFQNYYYVCRP
jgi:hypothetical protein